MTTQKPRRHFIAWSPKRNYAFRARTAGHAKNAARNWEWVGSSPRKPAWTEIEEEGWRVTEVSE